MMEIIGILPYILGFIVLYSLYYFKFRRFVVKWVDKSNVNLKNIGQTLPPFPNGWFIICKSKEIKKGEAKSIDIAGRNLVAFKNLTNQQIYVLDAYCLHMGANLGIGGKVVNQKCIQCPFHGWLYDGQTGGCVDYNAKQVPLKILEYDNNLGKLGQKEAKWKPCQHSQKGNLKKYLARQMNGYIYVWLNSSKSTQPQFLPICVEDMQKKLDCRGETIHEIYSHIQDIPQNGADVFHFKYVHKYPLSGVDSIFFNWTPKWISGDDPECENFFRHQKKYLDEFKRDIYNKYIRDYPNKNYLSFASIDNQIILPFFGKIFIFNLTIMQMGPGLVYVFFKSRFFTLMFIQRIYPQGPYKQILYHQIYSSNWLPYWLTASFIYGEGIQVFNDMQVWNAKKFSKKMYYKDNEADQFIKKWRTWFSKFYEGCKSAKQLKQQDKSW